MEESTNGAFANRGERVPVIRLGNQTTHSGDNLPGDENKGRRSSVRSKLGDKARKMVEQAMEKGERSQKSDKAPSMQDRLLEKYGNIIFIIVLTTHV